jgi:SAM-dependent methyltransferase
VNSIDEPYLAPYHRAVERHGAGFASLLWANQRTQEIRFDAIRRMADPAGKIILDAGCGRADYLAYLIEHQVRPAQYIGIEGVPTLADAAEKIAFGDKKIIRADFVRHSIRLFVGAEIVVFSGSLNTLPNEEFYATIRHAYEAAAETLIFNFLASWNLAGQDYLHWHRKAEVQRFVETFCDDVRLADDYLDGDCTVCLKRS